VAAQPVAQLVDSSGAGDAFAAGFLARYFIDADNLAAAAQSGHHLAAAVVQQHGAIIPLALMPHISLQGI
jgi:2-dehydro-3-deoxygluconokinase